MIFKAVKAAAQVVGIIDDDQLEDQPETIGELIHKQLHPTDPRVPASVGLVEGKVFDPQVPFEILTELFGVHQGHVKVHQFCCPDCGHDSEIVSDGTPLDGDAAVECEQCDFEGDVDDFHEVTIQKSSTSRIPTDDECLKVRFGSDTRPAWYADTARADLQCLFDHLNGHANDRCAMSELQNMDTHPLPQAEVVAFDEDDEDE